MRRSKFVTRMVFGGFLLSIGLIANSAEPTSDQMDNPPTDKPAETIMKRKAPPPAAQNDKKMNRIDMICSKLTEKLALTEKQREKIKLILLENRDPSQREHGEAPSERGEGVNHREQMPMGRERMAALDAKIIAVLTPEQQAKFKGLKEELRDEKRERKEERKEMRRNGGHGGPGGGGGEPPFGGK